MYELSVIRPCYRRKINLQGFLFSGNFFFLILPRDPRLGRTEGLLLFKYWPGITSYSSKLNAGLSVMFVVGSRGLSSGSISVSSCLLFTTSLALRQTKRKSSRTRNSWATTRATQRPQNSHSEPVNESQLRPARESGQNYCNGRNLT